MAEQTTPALNPEKKDGPKPEPKHPKHTDAGMSDLTGQLNTVARTVKILEDKYYNLRKKVQLNEENSLSTNKKLSDDMKVMQSDILEVKRSVENIKDTIRLIVKELKLTAKAEDVKVVEKYPDLWEPVDFITRKEAKKMIEQAVEEKFK